MNVRPTRDIDNAEGLITPSWNLYFSSLEKRIAALEANAFIGGLQLTNYASDAAAAAAGVPLYGFYANAGTVRQRIV